MSSDRLEVRVGRRGQRNPKGWREAEPLLALDAGQQGGQHGLDLHGGAGAHDRLPLVLEQLRHILGAARKVGDRGEAMRQGHCSPMGATGACRAQSKLQGPSAVLRP